MLEILFYTCAPKISIIWCIITEIRSETGRIFCHSGPFFALLPPPPLPALPPMDPENQNSGKMKKMPEDIIILHKHVYHRWQSYDVQFLRYEVGQTEFFVILDNFCPFTPLTTRKIKILKNWKKKSGNIIILHMCTTNENQMMYGSWDMKHDRQNFLSFWTVFLPFYLPNNLKNQTFEKLKKKSMEILSFYTCVPQMKIKWCMVPEILSMTERLFLSFWTTFCHFTLLKTLHIKILKNWKKKSGNIIILHMCTINDNQMMYGSWDIEHDRKTFLSFWTTFLPFYPP